METTSEPLIGSEQQIKVTRANSTGRTVYRSLLQVNPPTFLFPFRRRVRVSSRTCLTLLFHFHSLVNGSVLNSPASLIFPQFHFVLFPPPSLVSFDVLSSPVHRTREVLSIRFVRILWSKHFNISWDLSFRQRNGKENKNKMKFLPFPFNAIFFHFLFFSFFLS